MHIDPILPIIVVFVLVILAVAFLMRFIRQPYVIAYLIAGVLLGPHGFGLFEDEELASQIGSVGVMLLLFFVGMEVSMPKLLANWRIALWGTLLQIVVSVLAVGLIGLFLDWPLQRITLLGFVISLSSTAVVFKMLQEWNEMDSRVGQNVIGILIAQDMAVISMLLCLGWMSGQGSGSGRLFIQLIGAFFFTALIVWALRKGEIKLPFRRWLREDHEAQVFVAMGLCFGLALISGLMGLSSALGAFVAGILVSATKETEWVHHSLDSFRVVFLALFFVSIGMLIDLDFIEQHWLLLLLLVLVTLLVNTFINALALKGLGENWNDSLYAGAMLSQIGEFSFVLGAVGYTSSIISEYGYKITIATIALSLLFSPVWIAYFKHRCVGTEKAS